MQINQMNPLGKLPKEILIWEGPDQFAITKGEEFSSTEFASHFRYFFKPSIPFFPPSMQSSFHVPKELIGAPKKLWVDGKLTNVKVIRIKQDLNGNQSVFDVPHRLIEEVKTLREHLAAKTREIATLRKKLQDSSSKDRFVEQMVKYGEHIGRVRQKVMSPTEQGFSPYSSGRFGVMSRYGGGFSGGEDGGF